MTAFRKMQADATAKGLNIYIASGYRSYDYQVGLYNRIRLKTAFSIQAKVNGLMITVINMVSA